MVIKEVKMIKVMCFFIDFFLLIYAVKWWNITAPLEMIVVYSGMSLEACVTKNL